MWKSLNPILKILATLLVIVALLFLTHEIIEAKVFREFSNQPGTEVRIGSRSGNLFSGYILKNVEIKQTATQEDIPSSAFRTPRLTVHWELKPLQLTEISWDPGTFIVFPEDAPEEKIEVGEGSLLPDDTGWLVQEGDISIGPKSWDGSMTLKLRVDMQEIEGEIKIKKVPARIIRMMGEIPDGFTIPNEATVEIKLEGSPQSIRATGTVSDPFTRRTFRF